MGRWIADRGDAPLLPIPAFLAGLLLAFWAAICLGVIWFTA